MFNSFFVRVAFFQFFGILAYIFLFILWLYYFNLPDIDKHLFDSQQEILTRGLADISDGLDESTQNLSTFFGGVEKVINDTNSVTSSFREKKTEYVQLIAVHGSDGKIIYASSNHPFIDLLPLREETKIINTDGKEWHVFESKSHIKGYYLSLAESKQDRQKMIGNSLHNVLKFSSVILCVMGCTIIFSAYFTLTPLRRATKNIATRQLHNFEILDSGPYYTEIRPVIDEINKLIMKLHATNKREKRFLADAAHEIRTPTAAIQTQLYLLTQLQDSTEKNEVINDMMNTVKRISSLSNQLIHISRIESEEIKSKKEKVNINLCIRKCINFHTHNADKKRIKIKFKAIHEINLTSDGKMIFTVISNLLDNSIKYIGDNGNIEIILLTDMAHRCQISVYDDGEGIPEQYHTMIFNRFYRTPGVAKPGSGLGLAIVKDIVQKLNGQLDIVRGINGKGIGFTITLPKD